MHEHTLRLLALSSVATLAFACNDTRQPDGNLTPRTARNIDALTAVDTANRNLRAALTGAAHAAAFADTTDILHDLAEAGSSCSGEVAPPEGGGSGSGTTTGCGPSLDFQSGAGSAADDVAERILNAANVETSEATRIVLRLDPTRICGSSNGSEPIDPTAPPPPTTTSDCVQAFTDTPIRLELTSFAENDIDVAVLIGTGMTNAGTITLHQDEVAVEIDFGGLRPALTNLLEATTGSADVLPDTMVGRVRLSLTKNATDDFTAAFSILTAIHVAKTGTDAFDVSLGAASNILTVRANAATQQLTVNAAGPSAHIELPLDALFGSSTTPVSCTIDENGVETCTPGPEPTPLHGTVALIAGGFTGSAVVSAGDDAVHLTNLGLGTAPITATFDGMPLASFDLNPSSGRSLDLTIASTADGLSVKVSPRLDALVGLDLRTIADQVDSMPPWMQDEDLEVKLEGASNPELVLLTSSDVANGGSGEVPPPPMPSALMRIVSGTFSVSSRAAGKTVTVSQGMCMLDDPNAPETQMPHPLDAMVSGACP